MQPTPDQECDPGAMPNAAYDKCDKKIQILSYFALPAPAQGNINIVSQPGRKRNMPSFPEFPYACGKIRQFKIIGDPEINCIRDAIRDQRISP